MGLENFLHGDKGTNNGDSTGYGQTNPTTGYDGTSAGGNQFSENQTAGNQVASNGYNDPNNAGGNAGYNDERGRNAGRHENGTDKATGEHHGRFKNTAEGAAVGGIAGHEWEKHHPGGHGAGVGAAIGGVGGNEYNKHHNGGQGPANNSGANQSSTSPNNAEARHLNRTGKIEKAIGTVVCSQTLQQRGLDKQARAANMEGQHQNLSEAENLEAQAKFKRGQAVGLGAHPGQGQVGAGNPNNTY